MEEQMMNVVISGELIILPKMSVKLHLELNVVRCNCCLLCTCSCFHYGPTWCCIQTRWMERLLDWDSPKALHCVLSEQDTLFSALYWFNPGRQEIVLTWQKNCWLGQKASTQTNKPSQTFKIQNPVQIWGPFADIHTCVSNSMKYFWPWPLTPRSYQESKPSSSTTGTLHWQSVCQIWTEYIKKCEKFVLHAIQTELKYVLPWPLTSRSFFWNWY